MPLTLVVTNAGRAALVNAARDGTNAVRIASAGVSSAAVVAAPTATTLPGELKRIDTLSGGQTAADVIHCTVRDESMDSYTLRAIGLYLGDGTLFALYGQAAPIIEKSTQSLMLLAVDVTLADIAATQITFGNADFTNASATEVRAGVVQYATLEEELAAAETGRVLSPRALRRAIRRGVGNRPIDYDDFGGALSIRADPAGWDVSYRFQASNGASLGGFGAFGNAAVLTYYYVGPSYQAQNALRVYPSRVAWGDATIWHASNDGAGSGLDADLLDGRQAAEFALLTGSVFTGLVNLQAGMNVNGNAGDACIRYGTSQANYSAGIPAGSDVWRVRENQFGVDALSVTRSATSVPAAFYAGGTIYQANNPVWHSANDGAGSGLDADLLDGLQSSDFLRRGSGNRPLDYDDFGGALMIRANPAGWDMGFRFQTSGGAMLGGFGAYGGGEGLTYYYVGPNYQAQNALRVYPTRITWGDATVWHASNDGAGSGLDADLLDGQQGSWYADIVARLGYTPLRGGDITDVWRSSNDGAGSGLDADLLDGLHASDFARIGHQHGAADLAPAFGAASLSANGYQVLPGGLILQWVTGGDHSSGTESAVTVLFPIAFPNACLFASAGTRITVASTAGDAFFQIVGEPSTTGVTVMRQRPSAPSDGVPSAPKIFAIGY